MKHLRSLLALLLLTIGCPSLLPAQPPGIEPDKLGWAGEVAARDARIALMGTPEQVVELHLIGDARADTSNRMVALWRFTKKINGGKHLPNIAQQIGDCVSWGNSNAVEHSLATALVTGAAEGKFREAFPPYIYGVSRVKIGGQGGGGDGSCGIWAAKGLEQFGVLAQDEPDCPEYSGKLARSWGARPGPPQKWIDIASQFKCETRLVVDWDAATQSISNGWAIAVCSNAGFGKIVEENNRIEGRWTTSWAHCMCFIAYDSRPGREALYCLNSWGPNAHAKASRYAELDGAPPGGFWVLRKDAERMLKARDSYAISFTGFKPKKTVYEQLMKPGAN